MSQPNRDKLFHSSRFAGAPEVLGPQGGTASSAPAVNTHRRKRPVKKIQETAVPTAVKPEHIGRHLAQARQKIPQARLNVKEIVKTHISNLPAGPPRQTQTPAQAPVQQQGSQQQQQQQWRPPPQLYQQQQKRQPQSQQPATYFNPRFTLPRDFDSKDANGQLLQLLQAAPSAFPDQESPFLTAYSQTLMNRDPREDIYPPLLNGPSRFTKECVDSWRGSLPAADVQETISRIIWNVNEVIADRWPRLRFVVEPFGSVSWRGQTGSQGDLDLVLRDYSRPFGYTEDYWGSGGASNMKLPSVYNMNVVARALRESGFVEVEPIKWATTPITKFKDPFSGFEVDLNVNDLGGLYNSAMINAYCRLSPYQLRPLIHIVKSWSKARDLNNPSGKTGERSLSSYCWALLAIVYMQIKHGLPNLQDDDIIGSVGRQNIDVWVGWGRPKGIPAHVSFADDLGLKGHNGSKVSMVEWQGQKFLHTETSVGELVKGFFEFYAKLTSEIGKDSTSENFETHCLSVWKGGFVERGFPLDLRYDSKQQEYKRQRQLPAAAQQAEGIQPPPPPGQRSRPISGFSQPQEWSGADLVVQDPFLHDKNCASAMNHQTFQRLQTEFARGASLTASSALLETLLEICDPVEHKTKAERRAQERAARKEKGVEPQNLIAQPPNALQRRAAEHSARTEKETGEVPHAGHRETLRAEAKHSDATGRDINKSDANADEPCGEGTSSKSHDATLAAALVGLAVAELESDTEDDGKEPKMNGSNEASGPNSLGSVDTVYSADSIEWSPFRDDIFVCGTYQIQKLDGEKASVKEDQSEEESDSPAIKRLGRALVYQVAEEGRSFKEIQRLEGPAILDMKWSHPGASGGDRLAISNAEGQITVHRWNEEQLTLGPKEVIQVDDSSVLCLSLDWSNQLDPSNSTSIISSLSNGNLAHIVTETDGSMTVDHTWHAHDYEPWITAWDLWQPDTIWSGGDDLKLKRWDIRAPMMPALVNKQFEGGVTTIASSPYVENLLAVGSYDSNLRIFDARNARIPLQTIPVGGGIWRTKWHPSIERKGDVLLACMHGGFRVINLDQPESWLSLEGQTPGREWKQTALFDKHESIAYGVDWQRKAKTIGTNDSLVASCSFYDHLLHLWRA